MLKRNWKIVFVGVSILFDLLAIGLAALVVEETRHWAIFPTHASVYSLRMGGILYSALFVGLGVMMGVYRGSFHQSLRFQMLQMTRKYVYAFLLSLAFLSFLNSIRVDRHALVIFFSSLYLALILSKLALRVVNRLFQRFGLGVHPSLVVGDDESALMIFERFSSMPDLGYQMKGFITKNGGFKKSPYPVYRYHELDSIIKRKSIDRIFIPSTEMVANGYSFLRDVSRRHRIKLKVLSPQAEQLLDVARIYDIAGITLISPPRYHIDAAKQFLKRVFDIVGSLCILLVLSPVFLATIIGIYFETGRPFFFLQKRSSVKGGKEFYFIKFRSMVNDADEQKEDMFHHNQSDGALFKMKDDPRVTKVGRFLRKYSIDELPQLINVLKGDMSLVGPRPLPVSDFCKADMPDEFWEAVKDRASVKPGMTGLWQISGRSDIKFNDMILLDLYYVENYSLLFDLEILFETIPAVVFGKGAY